MINVLKKMEVIVNEMGNVLVIVKKVSKEIIVMSHVMILVKIVLKMDHVFLVKMIII